MCHSSRSASLPFSCSGRLRFTFYSLISSAETTFTTMWIIFLRSCCTANTWEITSQQLFLSSGCILPCCCASRAVPCCFILPADAGGARIGRCASPQSRAPRRSRTTLDGSRSQGNTGAPGFLCFRAHSLSHASLPPSFCSLQLLWDAITESYSEKLCQNFWRIVALFFCDLRRSVKQYLCQQN